MRYLLIAFFIFIHFYCNSQVYNAQEMYPNGRPKYKGKYVSCVVDFIDGVYLYEKRKSGKWIYYYPSGTIKRIEYHTKSKSCKKDINREGKWQYFNEEGVKYLEEKYVKDILVHREIDIYDGNVLYGKIIQDGNLYDTILFKQADYSQNLIPNPGFEIYYHKSVKITNEGQNQIEDIIPHWNSPDDATPDYYNNHRSITGVPNHLGNGLTPIDGNGYVGIMTFMDPNSRYESWEPQGKAIYDLSYVYSETIQSKLLQKLEKGETYCFKIQIVLSQNAGYGIDRFGVYLSDTAIQFTSDKFPEHPQLTFHFPILDTDKWTPLCAWFIADGNEKFITLGRFSPPEETGIFPREPLVTSELDINKSAYYLIDNVQLFKVSSPEACNCQKEYQHEVGSSDPKNLIGIENFDIYEENKVVLNNVNFDFDKYEIKQSSIAELLILKSFLVSNPQIKILITGHTDDSGSESYNQNLSYKRAIAIKNWLVKNGIESQKILCKGQGFDAPIADNSSDENKSINRRVEFEIIYQ